MMTFTLETARLRLRPFTEEEARHVVAGSREGRNWSPGYPRDDDRDIAGLVLKGAGGDPLFGPLQIVLLGSGAVIGGLGFFGPPDEAGTVGFGYGVAPEAEGRGYATEAVRALLREGFDDGRVRRALADTAHTNVASQRVLEKAGLRRVSSDDSLHYYSTED
ncbi:GNAT family N-acetyltransferase [Nonomuraea sp. ATR24]|uniref:GNAT family N-acetyltransferase n=1 Tax=Nonomuraea TaxID=83681 RepID=UPI001C5E36ED|nr:GNAT family N-acetyltransferase [Nonomuraea ceibae]